MNLILIRHTSVKVDPGICYGRSDVKLSENYEIDRNSIIEKIDDSTFDIIYTSPLSRCHRLACDLSGGKEVISDWRLSELDFGDWEGSSWEEIYKTAYGELWFARWKDMPCPNGESLIQMVSRVNDFLTEKIRNPENDNLLIVTHGGVIRIIITLLLNLNFEEIFKIQSSFGEITKLYFNSDNLSLVQNVQL